jgi:hypothetical protein
MTLYDRSFKLPVILEIENLSEEDRVVLLESLKEFQPRELSYPSEHALDVCKDMSQKGWPSLARALPLNVSSAECVQIFARCVKRFNENATIRRTPDTSRVDKTVKTVADFARIVDALTAQQDDITLSHIFKTDLATSNVFWSSNSTAINEKLSDNVIKIHRLGENEKDVEKRTKGLVKQISKCIETTRNSDTVTFKDAKNKQTFQYK